MKEELYLKNLPSLIQRTIKNCLLILFSLGDRVMKCLFRTDFQNYKGHGFKMKTNPFPHVLIQSQRICKEIFSLETTRPKALGLGNLFHRWLGHCLGCLDTKHSAWSRLKGIFKPLFEPKEHVYDELMEEWNKELEILYF
jgi:hypothetical protein